MTQRIVKELDISGNSISSDGFMYFSEYLATNPPLRHFNVSNNMIVGYVVKTFFDKSLSQNIVLEHLDLSQNLFE